MRRVPVLSTIAVAIAVLTMIGLGLWQLDRLGEKTALLKRYHAAAGMDPVPLPDDAEARRELLFRRTAVDCRSVGGWQAIAGRNADDVAGLVHIADCRLSGRAPVAVAVGWSRSPEPPKWAGGPVTGWIAPYRGGEVRVIADGGVAGFAAPAPPDPADVPNNHLAYAAQWFLFAFIALIIYGLALRRRWRERVRETG